MAPPGVDTTVFHPAGVADLTNDPYILSVARFEDPRKNVALLFEAYAHLREHVADAPRLVLAGKTGPNSSDWQLADRLGIRKFIDFRQGIELEQLAHLYRNAQFFVLSSDEEGFGMVVVEAMASGIPVISTRSGGPDGIIRHGTDGLLVPLQDAEALAAAMGRLVDSEGERRAMGLAARQAAEDRFSMQSTGLAFLNSYHALLGKGA